jgi:putative ABC transport system ATP-binding protein
VDSNHVLRVEHLRVTYRQRAHAVEVIRDLSFEARGNELTVVRGVSGSGKTSLLSCVAGILTPERGTIRAGGLTVTALDGRALRQYRRRHVGIVFQAFNLVPSLTAVENVAVPLLVDGVPFRRARVRAVALLERFGMADRLDHRPGALSGGERQRVAVARALARNPTVILADEPTSNLDRRTAGSVIDLLEAVRAPERVVLIATHDDRLVPLADRTIELDDDFPGPTSANPGDGQPVVREDGDAGGTRTTRMCGEPA